METTKAILIVSSHLSDAQELIIRRMMIEGNQHINFAKYVMWHCKGDLNQKIDADKFWEEFIKTQNKNNYNNLIHYDNGKQI